MVDVQAVGPRGVSISLVSQALKVGGSMAGHGFELDCLRIRLMRR